MKTSRLTDELQSHGGVIEHHKLFTALHLKPKGVFFFLLTGGYAELHSLFLLLWCHKENQQFLHSRGQKQATVHVMFSEKRTLFWLWSFLNLDELSFDLKCWDSTAHIITADTLMSRLEQTEVWYGSAVNTQRPWRTDGGIHVKRPRGKYIYSRYQI